MVDVLLREAHIVLGIEPSASCKLGKHSTNWPTSPAPVLPFSYEFTCASAIGPKLSLQSVKIWKVSSQFEGWMLEKGHELVSGCLAPK